jgi:hypothetical protein
MNQFAVRIDRAEKSSPSNGTSVFNSLQHISLDENDASIALSCPQKGTARRLAS